MSDERYPTDLAITEKDFHESGWKDVLSTTSRKGYSSMWQAFSAAARQAMDEGRQSYGKVLWLLADACSMMRPDWLGQRADYDEKIVSALSRQSIGSRLMVLFYPDDSLNHAGKWFPS